MVEPNGQVHPAAALFPMMAADELADLAQDIKANGLLQPIVLDTDGMVIDGRNRLAACAAAGVEPRYTTLNGHDPAAYILGANVLRRHLTQGQRAMVVAKSYKLYKRGDQTGAARIAGVPQPRLNQAVLILEYAEEQADSVISGAVAFDVAFRLAQARQEEHEAEARRAEEERQQLALLQERAPDLADLVVEERMSLDEAIGAYKVRHHEELEAEQQAIQTRQRMTANFVEAVMMIDGVLLSDAGRVARQWEPSGVGLVGSAEGKDQREWHRALQKCAQEAYIWRPSDWDEIQRVLGVG